MANSLPSSNRRVILGLMTFGPSEAEGARVTDLDTFNQILDHFSSRGYKELDTARAYIGGRQESFTRAAQWKEKGFQLDTKVKSPSKPGDNAGGEVRASVATSLAEAGTDQVDILYLHRPDRTVPFTETLGAMNALYEEGKFKRLGLSNFAAYEVAEVVMTCLHHGWVRPSVYQGRYNVLLRNTEPDIFNVCRRYGISYVAYNPIAGGLFSGQVSSKDSVPQTGRFSEVCPGVGEAYRKRYLNDGNFAAMDIIREALRKHDGLGMIDVALRWLVHHSDLRFLGDDGGDDGILIGVSSLYQLRSNLDSIERGPLPEDVVVALDEAWKVSAAGSAVEAKRNIEYSYDTVASRVAWGKSTAQ